jgi:SAM-dependent methyltransferase
MSPSKAFNTRTTCRLCGSSDLVLGVPLRPIPILSPNIGPETEGLKDLERDTAPLNVYMCHDCQLMQLTTIVDPSLQYDNFLYRTATSLGLAEHFGQFARSIIGTVKSPGKAPLVLDIGSNDGSLLRFYKDLGARVLGVDPARAIAKDATDKGIPTIGGFFTGKLASEIVAENGQADIIISNNTVANLDNLTDLVTGIRTCLAPEGVIVIETQYAIDVLEKCLLDVIYHEHLSYFTVYPMRKFLASHGLNLFKAERIWPKGGSIRFYGQHESGPHPLDASVAELEAHEAAVGMHSLRPYEAFNAQLRDVVTNVTAAVTAASARGPVAAYGTSVGCAALINQFDIGPRLSFMVDDNPLKEHLIGPNYDLEVVNYTEMARRKPSLVVALAWRYIEPILQRNKEYVGAGGKFLVPLPRAHVLP